MNGRNSGSAFVSRLTRGSYSSKKKCGKYEKEDKKVLV